VDWFDSERWRDQPIGEFSRCVTPKELLDRCPEVIWPGLMGADLLPIIGNEFGDWLCVRLGEGNVAQEVVYWYHGGGDWLPWGQGLPEALIFNSFCSLNPTCRAGQMTQSRDGAFANAISMPQATDRHRDRVLCWAVERIGIKLEQLPSTRLPEEISVNALLSLGIAEVPLRFLKVQKLLKHWSREMIDATLDDNGSERVGRIDRCLFDLDLIPSQQLARLKEQSGETKVQRWNAAAAHARVVTEQSPEQAWAWQILGYEAEKQGQRKDALHYYEQASQCSTFTDQTARFHFHWTEPIAAKFSVARLSAIDPERIERSPYYQTLLLPDVRERATEVRRFWITLSHSMMQSDRPTDATRCLLAAGWDVGSRSIHDYREVLELIVEASRACGQDARSELAATHLRCLEQRYF